MAGVAASGVFLLFGSVAMSAYLAVACLAMSFLCNQITEAAFWAAGIGVGGRNGHMVRGDTVRHLGRRGQQRPAR